MIINGKQYAIVEVKDGSMCTYCDFYHGWGCCVFHSQVPPCNNDPKIIFKEVKNATQS